MTGQLNAAAGLVASPGYTFTGATKTGFYLAGANQIGWASNGVQGATLNSDTSTDIWAGGATFGGTIAAAKGTIPIGGVMDFLPDRRRQQVGCSASVSRYLPRHMPRCSRCSAPNMDRGLGRSVFLIIVARSGCMVSEE